MALPVRIVTRKDMVRMGRFAELGHGARRREGTRSQLWISTAHAFGWYGVFASLTLVLGSKCKHQRECLLKRVLLYAAITPGVLLDTDGRIARLQVAALMSFTAFEIVTSTYSS